MVFYVPHGQSFYGDAFTGFLTDEQAIADHTIARNGRHISITPRALNLGAFHPKHFIALAEKLEVGELWLIDRVKAEEPVVQITDHRNLSGENTLAGRTPISDRPRFPDVSSIYLKKDLGLPRQVVSTVGHERFSEAQGENVSEVAAQVGLCASYAEMMVVGVGWNSNLDVNGMRLNSALFAERSL